VAEELAWFSFSLLLTLLSSFISVVADPGRDRLALSVHQLLTAAQLFDRLFLLLKEKAQPRTADSSVYSLCVETQNFNCLSVFIVMGLCTLCRDSHTPNCLLIGLEIELY
jgi:hypothetical protein